MKISFIVFLLFSCRLLSASSISYSRFENWFNEIEETLVSPLSTEEKMEKVSVSEFRIPIFNLQGLGKIYQRQDKEFKSLKKDFKEIEDLIGEVTMWKALLEEARARGLNQESLREIQNNVTASKEILQTHLEQGWFSGEKIKNYRNFLQDYSFGSYKEDRKYIIQHLVFNLSKVSDKKFDMNYLEKGNGVHELRRQLRWISIKVQALNGLVQYKKDQTCPVEAFSQLPSSELATSKYALIPENKEEKKTCDISQCLYLGLVEKIGQFGDLKDVIEKELHLTRNDDLTPEKYLPVLHTLYEELEETKLISHLEEEFKDCI